MNGFVLRRAAAADIPFIMRTERLEGMPTWSAAGTTQLRSDWAAQRTGRVRRPGIGRFVS